MTDIPTIYWLVDNPELPWYDKKVRLALSLAVNNQEIVDKYYGGYAQIMAWKIAPIQEFADMYVPLDKLPEDARIQFEYHPDKAKQLLAEAGYPNGFKASVVCRPDQVDLLSIVKSYWANVGVDLKLDVRESTVFWSIAMGHTYKEMIAHSLSSALPFKFTRTRPGGVYNWSNVNDPTINKVIDFVDANYFNEAARRQAVKDINPYILAQYYVLVLPGPDLFSFWQPWVKAYSGERQMGYANYQDFPMYVWLDQELKEKTTGKR